MLLPSSTVQAASLFPHECAETSGLGTARDGWHLRNDPVQPHDAFSRAWANAVSLLIGAA